MFGGKALSFVAGTFIWMPGPPGTHARHTPGKCTLLDLAQAWAPWWGGGWFWFWFWLATSPWSHAPSLFVHARPKAWECGVHRQYLWRSSPRIVFVPAHAACRVPGLLVLRTARLAFLLGHGPAHLSWAKNRTMVAH